MQLNEVLKTMRLRAGLTQTESAKELGVDQTAISQWESGETSPRLERIASIAKLYKCEITDLLNPDDS